MSVRDYTIKGYEYFGYSINEIEKAAESDKLLREFLLKQKKANKSVLKDKPITLIDYTAPQYRQMMRI